MILSFSKETFVQQILDNKKIHTIRADKYNRWKEGMKIHFWRSNPRNVSKNPYPFAEGTVDYIRRIDIYHNTNGNIAVFINDVALNKKGIEELAINDGFTGTKSFFTWFKEDFHGKIIHWKIDKILI